MMARTGGQCKSTGLRGYTHPFNHLRRGSYALGVDSSHRRSPTIDTPRRRGSAHEERIERKWATR
nr:MAG TPA: hypothetical protein [Caudoviricetes sp.]